MPIFAASDEQTVGLVGIAVVIGGAIQWLLQWLTKYLADRRIEGRKERQEDETGIIARYNDLYQRVIADREECRKENKGLQDQIDELQEKTSRSMVMTVRAVGWIRHLETILEINKVPFKPWSGGNGTGSSDATEVVKT